MHQPGDGARARRQDHPQVQHRLVRHEEARPLNRHFAETGSQSLIPETPQHRQTVRIIQNSIDDVYSLLKFLRHEPWCEHGFWKSAIGRVEDLTVQLDRVKRLLAPIMIRRTKETLGADG